MIVFVADNHYDAHPGRRIAEKLATRRPLRFAEDDFRLLTSLDECELLILNLIGGSCGLPLPDGACERSVRRYCERGGNLLLLHGAGAAFWHWPWWRSLVGLRWVRPGDPDGVPASTHPVRPYRVERCKTRHPLVAQLQPMSFACDEIYIGLETTAPCWPLLETTISEGTFIQCYQCATPWGGRLSGFLPGHAPEATADPVLQENIRILADDLLAR